MISLLAVAVLAGCSKNEGETPDTPKLPIPDQTAPIALSAGIAAESAQETGTKADLSGPVTGTAFPATTTNVFRLTGYVGSAAPTNWATPYFKDIQVNSGDASALSLATAQYYPANGDKVYFYAYSPAATTLTDGTASDAPVAKYTITGQQDIMAAQVTTGIAKAVTGSQSQPDLAFTHKLKQVKFKVKQDATFEANVKVTKILVIGVKNKANLTVSTGALAFEAGTADLTAYDNATGVTMTTAGADIPGVVMFEPGKTFVVRVTAGGVTYADATITLDDEGVAGNSYTVTLTFKRNSIVPSASITDWTDGGNANKDII